MLAHFVCGLVDVRAGRIGEDMIRVGRDGVQELVLKSGDGEQYDWTALHSLLCACLPPFLFN